MQAIACCERGEFKQAVVRCDAALRAEPSHFGALFQRGITYMKMGMYDRAGKDFAEALPSSAKMRGPTLYNRGLCHIHQGNVGAAVDDFAAASATDSTSDDYVYAHALACRMVGRYQDAHRSYQRLRTVIDKYAHDSEYAKEIKLMQRDKESRFVSQLPPLERALETPPDRRTPDQLELLSQEARASIKFFRKFPLEVLKRMWRCVCRRDRAYHRVDLTVAPPIAASSSTASTPRITACLRPARKVGSSTSYSAARSACASAQSPAPTS
jgi:tetratricopeptide (TPR) repeat protein